MTYLLRGIDLNLWTRVKVRAAKERVSIRSVLLSLLKVYASGRA